MVSKIFLVSDIHIRLYNRRTEYQLVLKRFLKYVAENKDDDSIIFIGGDLVHNKTDISPELVQMVSWFLKSCADLCPTMLILGNHDYNANNEKRLDPITPIVESLNHPNLNFWKDSGVYRHNGVAFSVFSLLGSQDDWVPADKIKSKYKVACFHGPVIGKHSVNSYFEEGARSIAMDKFAGFDIVLLGDIHHRYFLNDERTIGYPSSLLQQNNKEPVYEHGIIVWDVKNKSGQFVDIDNDYCYHTLDIINNHYTIPKKLPKKVRLRVRHENSDIDTINEAINLFSQKFTIIELTKNKLNNQSASVSRNTKLGNSRDVQYQNSIIEEYLKAQDVSSDIIEEIKNINFQNNKLFEVQNIQRNITWIPKKLEFSNMFSYGENNEIDFSEFNGVYGISAPNMFGKSAILDALCFAIYDKSTRATKAIHILNNTKNNFGCKFTFEFKGQEYAIERVGQKNEKTGAVRVDVNFWTVDEDGNTLSLNGEDRDQTNKAIREYLGTYDDFVMTALSTQYDNHSFVEKTQRERKDLLYKFLDISIYDELFKSAKETTKEQQVLIKEFEKENLYDKSSQIYGKIDLNEVKVQELLLKLNEVKFDIKNLNDRISDENKRLQKVDNNLIIADIERGISSSDKEIITGDEAKVNIVNQITDVQKNIEFIQQELSDVDIDWIVSDKTLDQSIKEVTKHISETNRKISLLENEIENCESKISHLANHEYDPNCEFCCKNEFVIDANLAKEKLPDIKDKLFITLSELSAFEANEFHLQIERTSRNHNLKLIEKLNNFRNEETLLNERLRTLLYKIENSKSKLTQFESDKQKYYELEQIILDNEEIEGLINQFKIELRLQENVEVKIQKEYQSAFSNLSNLKIEYDSIQQKIQRYTELLKSNRIYDIYCQALNRDGVPYLILERILPLIEYEVNEVLSQVVNFSVRLESTEEKYIHAYIDYGNNSQWPVELTSGMERFILSLAFRTSLTEITSLPRAPFLAIDEGFGVLDSDNLLAMGKLFEFLKSRYNYLLVISHIDSMKDLVEKQISIVKENGYSKILMG